MRYPISVVATPLTYTTPCFINSAAPRREETPHNATYLLRRISSSSSNILSIFGLKTGRSALKDVVFLLLPLCEESFFIGLLFFIISIV